MKKFGFKKSNIQEIFPPSDCSKNKEDFCRSFFSTVYGYKVEHQGEMVFFD